MTKTFLRRGLAGLAVLAAATALALPAAAAQHPVTAAFKDLCVATGGTLKPTLAAADKAGWAPIPEDLVASGMTAVGEMKVRELGARVMVVDRRFLALIVGIGEMDEEDTVMEMALCGVVTFAKDGKALMQDVTVMSGIPPIANTDPDMAGYSMWLYVDGAKGREYFTSLESVRVMRAMLNGELHMLMVGEDEGMAMILHMRPIMAEKN